MTRFVAFLRAINLGNRNIKMDRLRSLFEQLDFEDVATFIASGNVIFESGARDTRKLEHRIERHLHSALGYEVDTFVRTIDELAAIDAYQPFPEEAEGSLLVGFIRDTATEEQARTITALRTEADEFHVHGREVYWLARRGVGKSLVKGGNVDRAARIPMTVRNVNTVKRILARYR